MLVSLSLSMFSPKKTDKKVTKEVLDQHQASESSGKFVKTILPELALESLKRLQSEIREYHYENTLPWSVEGAAILSSTSYLPYVDKMRAFNRQWDSLVDAFIEKYDEFKESARTSLNGMYDPEDYPSKDRVRKKFKFKTEFLPIPDTSDFRVELAEADVTELREQMQASIAQATENARRELWGRLIEPVKKMADRLSDPDAKVYESYVDNIREIAELIPALNVTGDANLERMRQQVLAELTCCSVDRLRNSPSTKRETAQKANAILATMADYLPADGSAPAAAPMQLPPEPAPDAQEPFPLPVVPPLLTPVPHAVGWRSRLAHSR